MDNPLYERLPGKVTALHSIITPNIPDQKVALSDGKFMNLQAGATAFISGARAFSLLTPEEQEFALNTDIQYAPRAYEWIRDCKATSDGLGIVDQGKERAFDDLNPWEWQKVHRHPVRCQIKLSCGQEKLTLYRRWLGKIRADPGSHTFRSWDAVPYRCILLIPKLEKSAPLMTSERSEGFCINSRRRL